MKSTIIRIFERMKSIYLTILLLPGLFSTAFGQTDSIEIYLIDSYATMELPHMFKLSFYTSEECKSKVILDDKYEYDISDSLTELHNKQIDLTNLDLGNKVVPFVIVTEDSLGGTFTSETFDFDLPYEPEIERGSNLLQLCLFGGAIFLLPYPNLVVIDGEKYFSLTKDIPILSFRSRSLNYPGSYISIEYSYIFNANLKNYLRLGYKQFYEIPVIRYLSPGVTAYTNFSGGNGIGVELSAGLFTIENTFTLYTRYRYNLKPGSSKENFYEVSLGLYSGFFSFYLN